MAQRYNTDDPRDLARLIRPPATANGMPQCLPRTTVCGSAEAERMGLTPLLDYPDKLIDPADYKEVIERCHEKQLFPMYHHEASHAFDAGWDQNGLGYCWTFGATAATMDARALEGQSPVRLAPTSLGWLVNWRNRGYYCDRTIAGARERGIASADFVPDLSINPREFKEGWEDDALNYRPTEWWDTRWTSEASMIQQAITLLATPRPGYIAYNWWSHALAMVGVRWDEKERNNLVWLPFNSHDDGIIELTGSRAVPDELYVVRATSLPR